MSSNTSLLHRSSVAAACFGLGLVLLSGCGTTTENNSELSTELGMDGGSVLITDPQLGQVDTSSGLQVPDSWPAAVPLYPAGDLALVEVNDSAGVSPGINAMWTEPRPSKEAWNDYFDALMKMGYAETGFVLADANGENTSIHSLRGNGWDLTLTFTSSKEEGGIIQLTGLPTTQ